MVSQYVKCDRYIYQRAIWERRRWRGELPRYPISVSMTPAFYDEQHILLRTQLNCLSKQTVKDFDVWLIDPHYQKRKSVIPEFATRYGLDIKHVPYTPNQRVAKLYDCAIFNAAFCYSNAPMSARFSCYRFVRPTWVERILSAPKEANVDFYMHAVGPDILDRPKNEEKRTNPHRRVWHFESDEVHWDQIPTKSAWTDDSCAVLRPNADTLATWPPFMDHDVLNPTRVTLNIYGNIAWRRSQWLAINGTNEVITNAAHWEDIDFDCRAAIASQSVVRYSHLLYRLQHTYGSYSQRSNVPVDAPLRGICACCRSMMKSNRGDADYGSRLKYRLRHAAVDHFYQYNAWVCRKCHLSGPIYDELGLTHYCHKLEDMRVTRAPVLPKYRIGRNLQRLAERMDRTSSLSSKVSIYNDSWSNPHYYEH